MKGTAKGGRRLHTIMEGRQMNGVRSKALVEISYMFYLCFEYNDIRKLYECLAICYNN